MAWIVTPVPGAPLSDRLRGAPMPRRDAWSLLASVAAALDALHAADAVHGRLGPSTVVLNPAPVRPTALVAGAGAVSLLAAGGTVAEPRRHDDVLALAGLIATVLIGRTLGAEPSRWADAPGLPPRLAARLRALAAPGGTTTVRSCAGLVAAFEQDSLVASPGP